MRSPLTREKWSKPKTWAFVLLVVLAAGTDSRPATDDQRSQLHLVTSQGQMEDMQEVEGVLRVFVGSADPVVLCSLLTDNYLAESERSGVIGNPVQDCESAAARGLEEWGPRGTSEVVITDVEINGESAEATVQTTFPDGGEAVDLYAPPIVFKLRKVEEHWLIDAFVID